MKTKLNISRKLRTWFLLLMLSVFFMLEGNAQFVHPGITHKLSDLDRMKYMVEAQIDPWYTSYQEMASDSKSSYNYNVQGNSSYTVLARDSPYTNLGAWNSDIRAAYYNAIRWYVTGDTRHADKAVEIFNTWKNLTSVTSNGTDALSGGLGYIMIEAAEIIRHTYSGWSSSDIEDFEDMLVYPGYSTSSVPSGNTTFYWMAYNGDDGRHGNQGLSGWRTVMAMGIFLDNETMYQRALRYVKGQSHLPNDLPYGAGPPIRGPLISSSTYENYYNTSKNSTIEDYIYNDCMEYYIWENGQCQESSRDQQHTMFGIGLLTSMAEMAWNQGEDLYAFEDDRLLLGLEYNMRYNTTSWNPTVSSGEFIERDDRTLRWRSKAINPAGRNDLDGRPTFELPVAHYVGRGLKTTSQVQYTIGARDESISENGYEKAGWTNDHLGWGALNARRPDYCYGDPISGFSGGLPVYEMNVLPMTIEAENFDYPGASSGEDRTYNETTSNNSGGEYRPGESVDIETCSEGGYNVGWIANGEWLTYTVYVPEDGTYNISMRYASTSSTGTVKVLFGGIDKTGFVSVPNTGDYQIWDDLNLATGVTLTKGVQSMKILVGTGGFNINHITISGGNSGGGPNGYSYCSDERETCTYSATVNIAYGANGSYNYLYNQSSGSCDCSNASFGDPLPGVTKACYVQPVSGGNCDLPWSDNDISVSGGSLTYSETVDISCASSATISMDIEGLGTMEPEDYLNIYYKVDGGSQQVLSENVDDFSIKTVSATVSGNSVELIMNIYNSSSAETYNVTEINIEAGSCDDDLPWSDSDITVSGSTLNYSEMIDISCASSATISMDIEGLGTMEPEDYLNIYYKVDGGSQQVLSENVDDFSNKTVSATISGNSVELIMNIYNSASTETYNVSNISITTASNARLGSLSEISNLTEVPELSNVSENFLIYPNPTSDRVTIIFPDELQTTYSLIDNIGKTIATGRLIDGSALVDLSGLKSGVYFIKVDNNQRVETRKIIVE